MQNTTIPSNDWRRGITVECGYEPLPIRDRSRALVAILIAAVVSTLRRR